MIVNFLFTALPYLVTLIVGTGAGGLIKLYIDNKKVNSDVESANLKVPAEVESIQIAGMKELVVNLQENNRTLREERDYWMNNYETMKLQVAELETQLKTALSQLENVKSQMDAMSRPTFKENHNE